MKFSEAPQPLKQEMILDAYKHISADVNRVANDLKRLNNWLASMDITEAGYAAKLTECLTSFTLNSDNLTEQFVRNNQKITVLLNLLTKK